MLDFKKTLPVILLFAVLYSNVKSQTKEIDRQRQAETFAQEQRQRQDFDRRRRELDALTNGKFGGGGNAGTPLPKPVSMSKEERARILSVIAPDAADAAKYRNFLKQKNTGLFRLFPDLDCESKNVVRADGDCANFVPGSSNYSFRGENYSDAYFLDVKLKRGNLISNGFLSQGILVRLGDVPLESVSPTGSGLKFLFDFVPQVENAEAKKQFAEIEKGVVTDGYKYAKTVEAEENTTYALRVVAYRSESLKILRPPVNSASVARGFSGLNYDDRRIDLTVAFRIVKRDQNGGITILWKELNRGNAPKIVFTKRENASGIKR